MNTLPSQMVIENVIQCKMRGKVIYQSHFPASVGLQLIYVKPYDLPLGKGYQRPVDMKRCDDFARYLSNGENALFTPILLNAGSNWEFISYDRERSSFGRLLCKRRASLMDGQHRMGGIEKYIKETNSELNVPFLAFHNLDEDEEIKLFDTINTKAKGIGTSLSKYLRRDSDDISWVATELMVRKESPFYSIGSIIGKRTKGRHVTLQNVYKTLHLLTTDYRLSSMSKEQKLAIAITYFDSIKNSFQQEWDDYKNYRLTHIVCLDALSIAGSEVLLKCISKNTKQIDLSAINKFVTRVSMDWSANGPFKYLKGMGGSRSLSIDLKAQMLND
ncbi:DGQHR domain-containing protein [Paenibacillus antarcticus]|uniref:DGQHR domain-containing protein n=1 Tax=Paenibacillus antarcticus TaxID=253703 RepID=A0A168KAV9_9BACL|nr:DGQHR domain-containing protein [Paenibacillus antarcticus]OAB41784.1 hypothetical protein PBAT_20580 [Paenibacillus antarcticus]